MTQRNLKQPWAPLRRFGRALAGRSLRAMESGQDEEENPWFRLASESNRPNNGASVAKTELPSGGLRPTSRTTPRWAGSGVSPYGFSDDDGTLKQVESSNWRRLLPVTRKQRFIPTGSTWQTELAKNGLPNRKKTNSTWLLQSVLAVSLVALGLYASHGKSVYASKLQGFYQAAFAKDYSGTLLPTIDRFLLAHRIPIPAWAQSGAIRLHVPLAGAITTDYSPQHPEMVIQGTPNEAILSAGSGTVTKVDPLSAGYLVVVDHGQLGVSIYAGVGKPAVHTGEYVTSGQVLGHLPATSHPDLRFSIESNGHYMNPHDYIHFPATPA